MTPGQSAMTYGHSAVTTVNGALLALETIIKGHFYFGKNIENCPILLVQYLPLYTANVGTCFALNFRRITQLGLT